LSKARNIDISNIVYIGLIALSDTGLVWVFDIAASQKKINQPVKIDLPVVSVQSSNVTEGFGIQTAYLNITCDRVTKSAGVVWLSDSGNLTKIKIPAGSSGVIAQIPFSWQGDNVYASYPEQKYISIEAVQGFKLGERSGVIQIIEDDPPPKVSVTKRIAITDGSNLMWTFKLSTATARMDINCYFIKPSNGTELTTADVPTSWLKTFYQDIPTVPTPLSQVGLYGLGARFLYGVTTAYMVIPTLADRSKEDTESVSLLCSSYELPEWKATLIGIITGS
jgi:hypothetical protein